MSQTDSNDKVHLAVCLTCRPDGFDDASGERPGRVFARRLKAALAARGLAETVEVTGVNCLSVCTRPCAAAFSAPGKFTYVIGDLDAEAGVEDAVAFAEAHAATADGIVPWRERPQAVRRGTVARIPPPGHEGAPVAPIEAEAPTSEPVSSA